MKELFNIKMRASKCSKDRGESKHISGAEKISCVDSLDSVVKGLVDRAFNHEKGKPDSINISIDKVDKSKITYIPCIDVATIESETPCDGRNHIVRLLQQVNIEDRETREILDVLDNNWGMRGSILFDVSNMERVDSKETNNNGKRGIRATGMDWDERTKDELERTLEDHSLNNNHVKEALVLASKVIYPKGVLAEICISDDPNYTTGYVSIKNQGYFRITNLKKIGSQKGGRIILFDSTQADVNEYINFLEHDITLIYSIPHIN